MEANTSAALTFFCASSSASGSQAALIAWSQQREITEAIATDASAYGDAEW